MKIAEGPRQETKEKLSYDWEELSVTKPPPVKTTSLLSHNLQMSSIFVPRLTVDRTSDVM